MLLVATVTSASAQNVLVNPGFELPAVGGEVYGAGDGWIPFGNVFLEPTVPGCLEPASGNQLVKMFGNFCGAGCFNVTGIFQEFPTQPGDVWTMWCRSRNAACDPMVGAGAPNANWVVQKLAFFDAANTEIGAAESTVLDGSFPLDLWNVNAPIFGTAPVGAVKVQAFILYLQPNLDGGAAQIDDVTLELSRPTPSRASTWGKVKSLYR
jgi:hypothetical protein